MTALQRFITASGIANLADGVAGVAWGWDRLTSDPRCAFGGAGAGGLDAGRSFCGDGVFRLVWNVVSVSTRQRTIPDALLGQVNSIYRLLAWGVMPLGLILSGIVVSSGELILPRGTALALPFWAAAPGSVLLTFAVRGGIRRGFDWIRARPGDSGDSGLKHSGSRPYIEDRQRRSRQLTGTERSADWLKAGGLRPTRQRLALAGLLVGDGLNRHVTAESLYALSSDAREKVSLATVYNTLRAFCDAGLMNEIVVDGSKSYFDTRTDDHPHFYWEDSHSLTDAPADELEISSLPQVPEGMTVTRVDVVIRLRKA